MSDWAVTEISMVDSLRIVANTCWRARLLLLCAIRLSSKSNVTNIAASDALPLVLNHCLEGAVTIQETSVCPSWHVLLHTFVIALASRSVRFTHLNKAKTSLDHAKAILLYI